MDSASFMPHGHCYLWQPGLVWSMVITDLLIGISYVVISATLYILVRKIKLPFSYMFLAFGLFILACGATHFMEVYTLWIPNYWAAAGVKLLTAGASVVTAVYLIKLYPDILQLSSVAKDVLQTKTAVEDFFFRRLKTSPEIKRLLNRAVTLPLAFATGLILIALFEANYLRVYQNWVDHSTEVIRRSQSLRIYANEAQIDLRAYRLGLKDLAIPMQENRDRFESTYTEVEELVSDNPDQTQRLRAIRAAFDEWKSFADEMKQVSGPERADQKSFQDFYKRAEDIRMRTLKAIDEAMAHERTIRVDRQYKTSTVAVLLVVTIGILVLVLASIFALFGRGAIRQVSNTYAHALEAEQRSREKAESAVQAREDFMSMASHELKTPLSALKLQLELLERKNRGQDQQAFPGLDSSIDLALRQVRTLNTLVDDLLDTSRIETGQLAMNPEPTDLSTVVEDIARRLANQLKAAKCTLDLHLQKPIVGHWDADRLGQVVGNLLSNAMKYAPEKPIHIATTKKGGIAVLTVEDGGPGIEKELQTKIFERFERGNNKLNASGLGLGLFIVKNIVETKGGRIYVESEPGKGSTFFVEIPLAPTIPTQNI